MVDPLPVTAYDLALRFVGVREVPGREDNAQILAMLRLDGDWPEHDEVPWCFSGDVELLTSRGFVRFDQLGDDAVVAQVDPACRVSFTRPLRLVRREHEGEVYRLDSRDFGLTCDAEHRFFGTWNRANAAAGPLELRPLGDLTSVLFVPAVSTALEEDSADWSDRDLSLLAAFLSDGSFHRGRISIQVSKARKLEALHGLEPLHVYEAKRAYGRSRVPLTTFEFAAPSVFEGALSEYKRPTWGFLRELSRRQLRLFLDAYVCFDGHESGGSRSLYTSESRLRDWLQAAVTLAGYHSSWRQSSTSSFSGRPCYEVTFCPAKRTRNIRPPQVHADRAALDLYCVEVPTGVIVIRDPRGTVIPVGNCSAFTNYVAWLLRLPRSKRLNARSWLEVGRPVLPAEAEAGWDVAVFWRRDPEGPWGHVGFFAGWTSACRGREVLVLGGNQGDQVSVAPYDSQRLLGIRRLRG